MARRASCSRNPNRTRPRVAAPSWSSASRAPGAARDVSHFRWRMRIPRSTHFRPNTSSACNPVVRATRDAQVCRVVGSTERSRLVVIQLEERARRQRRPCSSTNVHCSPSRANTSRRTAAARGSLGRVPGVCVVRRGRLGLREPLLLELLDERIERSLDARPPGRRSDCGAASGRLRAFELVAQLGAHGELHLVASSESGSMRAARRGPGAARRRGADVRSRQRSGAAASAVRAQLGRGQLP